MFFEKFVNSKFYKIVDYIVKVVMLNTISVLFVILGLVFFTLGPVILAGVYSIKLMLSKYEGSIFRVFITAFKRFYVKATQISAFYLVLIIIVTFNIFFFINQMEKAFDWFSFISFMIMLLVIIFAIPAYIHSLLIYSCYEDSTFQELIFDGFKLSFAYVFRGLLFMVILFNLIYVSLLIPIVAVIIGFFLIQLSIEFLLFKPYDKIDSFDNNSNKKAEELLISSR